MEKPQPFLGGVPCLGTPGQLLEPGLDGCAKTGPCGGANHGASYRQSQLQLGRGGISRSGVNADAEICRPGLGRQCGECFGEVLGTVVGNYNGTYADVRKN
ncbi:hypothetical protein GCM10009636_22140 [Arthrobacter koreensis]